MIIVTYNYDEWLKEPIKVYNLEVEGLHTYYVTADRVLVLNEYDAASTKWKGFRDGELSEHYDKHGQEFGEINKHQYLNKAKEFASEISDSFRETVVGNFVIKYDPDSGRMFIGHIGKRQIRTFLC